MELTLMEGCWIQVRITVGNLGSPLMRVDSNLYSMFLWLGCITSYTIYDIKDNVLSPQKGEISFRASPKQIRQPCSVARSLHLRCSVDKYVTDMVH